LDPQDVRIRIKRLRPGARIPRRQTPGASGWDLHACLEEPLRLRPGQRVSVPTGLAVALPPGYELQIRPRSGLALRHGLTLLNAPGTVDSDYRGEIRVILVHQGEEEVVIRPGDRIAQMVLSRVPQAVLEEVEELDETLRGSGGFGHTGVGEGVGDAEGHA
jgi:dUTP pyrophosphatase